MAKYKFVQQINLLTRKNLKIRFSHRCLSFWELGLPLIIAAILGALAPHKIETASQHAWDWYRLKNETRYDFINNAKDVALVKHLSIHYMAAENADHKTKQLVENIMEKVLNATDVTPTGNETLQVNWKKSTRTEKQLEQCIFQPDPDCVSIDAAVIFTRIQDDVSQSNKFGIEYKIRLMKSEEQIFGTLADHLYIMSLHEYYPSSEDYFEILAATERDYFCHCPSNQRDTPDSCTGRAFTTIQALLDRGIMAYIKAIKHDTREYPEVQLSLVRMPYKNPKTYDIYTKIASKSVPLLVSLIFSLTIFSLMQVNSEKCSGFKELLRMHGISSWTQWVAWLWSSFLVYFIWTALLSLLVCTHLPGLMDPTLTLSRNGILLWILLLLFVMSITTFSFLVSVFFERVWTAACVGLVTWILLNIFMIVFGFATSSLGEWTVLGGLLVPPVAFDMAIELMHDGGASFSTMNSEVLENVPLTFIQCLIMLLLDSCIFMVLAMYLDNVLPSKYGVRKPYLYFLWEFREFVCRMRTNYQKVVNAVLDDEGEEMMADIPLDSTEPFEPDPESAEAAVVIRNLRKIYGWNKRRALDGLSAKMFTGEIFALLGFNGAGKTTLMSILTGLTGPTDGDAFIFGLDIQTEMEEIRKHIGLCPQHNLLSNEMSVLEQVDFFGRLKGLDASRTRAEELLKWLDMPDKLHSKPDQLSGGQMRRVQLAIALIGDTKLAFLDEPTSGLDPESRREVWDILLKLRGKMTLVLTTHTMEESDILGDRIGIMSDGKMMCCGTPSFLRKHYGVGYNLKISPKDSQSDSEKLYSFIKRHVPSAQTDDGPSLQENLLSFSLPISNLDLTQIANLMEALHEEKEQLHVENIGLSMSSMNEVFLKVGDAVQAVTTSSPVAAQHSSFNSNVSSNRVVGSKLRWYRYITLLMKRMRYFLSTSVTLLLLTIFSTAALWIALTWFSFKIYTPTKPGPPRIVSSSSLEYYSHPVIMLHDNINMSQVNSSGSDTISFTSSYLSQLPMSQVKLEEYSKATTFEEMISSLEKSREQDLPYFRQHYLVGVSFNRSSSSENASALNITGFFSAYALHSAPLSLNLISQSVIKEMTGVDATIKVVNHPFHINDINHWNHYSITPYGWNPYTESHVTYFIKLGESMLVVVIITLLTATAALLPTQERLNKGKQLQLMTGTSPLIYWLSIFSWDFIFFSLVNLVITTAFVLADYSSGIWIFTNNGAGAVIYLILECHLFATLWFSYVVSSAPCIKTPSGGFIIISLVALIVGIVWNLMRQFALAKVEEDFEDWYFPDVVFSAVIISAVVAWLVPMYSLFLCIMKLDASSFPNSMCNWFPDYLLQWACSDNNDIDWDASSDEGPGSFLPRCCSNCGEMFSNPAFKCFKPESYFNTSRRSELPIDLFLFREPKKSHALVFDLMLLVWCGVVWAVLLFSMEYLLPKIRRLRKKQPTHLASEANVDTTADENDDMTVEANRVEDIIAMGNGENAQDAALVAHDLHLKFGNLEVIKKGLSFAVDKGDCFGLLGVNAAGKTSVFRILTGDIIPSAGNMYSSGVNYCNDPTAYLSNIGYCPQFDAIIGVLTGLEMVKLYGALRGIPPERLDEHAKLWLDKFGLLSSANKKCGEYSGGMKRRLSAAMAFIGSPKLLLLDEPTTGVDPVFRREFWNIIREVREAGQSVVLTSHTMDECEALCTRLGIMVNGQFKSLGSVQNFKRKYGKGYILTVKLQKTVTDDEEQSEREENVKLLVEKIVESFSPCRLQLKQRFLIQYQILNRSLWYGDIFRKMGQICHLPEISQLIEEFWVTESSLEDAFLSISTQSQ